MFLAPTVDKQAHHYDIECSNHYLSQSPEGTGIEQWSEKMVRYIYANSPRNAIVRLYHPPYGDSQGQEAFLAPVVDKQTHNYGAVKKPSLSITIKH